MLTIQAESAKSQDLYLYVELPKFDFPIVYTEAESPVPQPPLPQIPKLNTQPQINPALKPNAMAEDPWLWRTYDPDAWRDNPVQIKHTKLLRSERLGEAGRDLKPGPADRDRLNVRTTVSLGNAEAIVACRYGSGHPRAGHVVTKRSTDYSSTRQHGKLIQRKSFAFLLQPHCHPTIKTYYGASASPSSAVRDHSPNSSNASHGPIPSRQNRQWKSSYRCGATKWELMMRWNCSDRVSRIPKLGRLQSRG